MQTNDASFPHPHTLLFERLPPLSMLPFLLVFALEQWRYILNRPSWWSFFTSIHVKQCNR